MAGWRGGVTVATARRRGSQALPWQPCVTMTTDGAIATGFSRAQSAEEEARAWHRSAISPHWIPVDCLSNTNIIFELKTDQHFFFNYRATRARWLVSLVISWFPRVFVSLCLCVLLECWDDWSSASASDMRNTWAVWPLIWYWAKVRTTGEMKFKCQVWVWVAVVAFLLMGYASASGKSIRGSRHLYVASSVSQWRQPGVAPHRAARSQPSSGITKPGGASFLPALIDGATGPHDRRRRRRRGRVAPDDYSTFANI